MHKSAFEKPLTIEDAFSLIQNNNSQSYNWFPVKTECGNIIELGGNNKELKVYVIKLDSNHQPICCCYNDFVEQIFSISLDDIDFCRIDLPNSTSSSTKFKNKRQLIDWLNTTPNINFIQPQLEPVYDKVISHFQIKI